MTIYEFVCPGCMHWAGGDRCDAFHSGIPDAIISGAHDHTEPFPGDNGIRFEPIEDE